MFSRSDSYGYPASDRFTFSSDVMSHENIDAGLSTDHYIEVAGTPSSSTADLLGYLHPAAPSQRESYLIAVNNPAQSDNEVTMRARQPLPDITEMEQPDVNNTDKVVDKTFIGKCSFYILVAMVIISSLMAISATVIMVKLLSRCDALEQRLGTAQASYVSAQQDAHMCVSCDDLTQGPFEEDNVLLNELLQRSEGDSQICCAKTATQFSILLKLFSKHIQLEKCAQELLKDNSSCRNSAISAATIDKPGSDSGAISAHLIGRQHIPEHAGAGMQPIRSWEFDHPTTHTEGLHITDHRIIVPETGLYFIYSQAGFLFYYDEGKLDMSKGQTLYHTVYRYNPIYPNDGNQQLLRSATTQCWAEDKAYGRYTTYVAAAIKLVKGDQLYVKVSHISALAADMSYFGLFKIR